MSSQGPPPASRGRMLAARILVVLGAIVAALALIAGYIRYQALDTDTVRETAGELIEDDAIRDQIAASLVDQLFSGVNLTERLEQRLPEDQQQFAAPAAAALRGLADQLAPRLLERPRPQQLWINSVALTHEQLIRALEDELAVVQTEEGFVVLNLNELVEQLAERVQVLGNLVDRLPEDTGQIRIMESDQLETAQEVIQAFDSIALIIPFVALLLWAVAIWLARGRRRTILRSIAFASIVVGLLVLVVRRAAGTYVVNSLTAETPAVETPAANAWDILTHLLAEGAWTLMGAAVVALVGVWLAGPSRSATAARRDLAPFLARPEIAFGVPAVLLLLLVWWGPTAQTHRWQFVLTTAVVVAIGVEALRRVARREHPDAAAVGAGDAARAALGRQRPTAGTEGPGEDDHIAQLERLARLRQEGVLTDAELEAEKARLRAGAPGESPREGASA